MRKLCILLALLFLGLAGVHAAEPNLDRQIADARSELAKQDQRRAGLRARLTVLEQGKASVAAARARQEGLERNAGARVGAMHKQLRQLDAEIAKLTAPYDLSVAWKNYDAASGPDKPAAFKTLFRLARGREPNNEEMADFRLEAKILEIEIRKKAIVPVGLALARIGNTIVELPKFAAGLTADVQNAIGDIVNNVNSAAQSVKGLIDGVANDPELAGRLAPVLRGVSDTLGWFKGATDPVNKVLGLADEVKGKAMEMATDSYQQYKESVYGTVDPKAAREKAQRERDELAAKVERLQAGLADLKPGREQVASAQAGLDQAVAEIQADLRRLDQDIAATHGRIDQMLRQKLAAEFQEKMASVTLTPYVRSLGWLNVGGMGRHRRGQLDLAVDDVTAFNLDMPRSAPYGFNISLVQAGTEPCAYCPPHDDQGRPRPCGRSSMKVVRNGPTLDHYAGITPSVEGTGLRVEQGQFVASGLGEGKIKPPTTSGVVSTRTANHTWQAYAQNIPIDKAKGLWVSGCSSNSEVVTGNITSQGPEYPYTTHQIKSLQLLEGHPPSAPGEDYRYLPVGQGIDLFAGPRSVSRQGWAFLRPEIVVADGKAEHRQGVGRFSAELDGDSVFKLDKASGQITLTPLASGRGTLRVALTDAAGNRHFEQSVRLAAASIEGLEWAAPLAQARSHSYYVNLPIGETFNLRLALRGDVDLSRYHVRWSTRNSTSGVQFSERTGFHQEGGRWVSENRIRFEPSRIKAELTKSGNLSEVLDISAVFLTAEMANSQGDVVYRETGPQLNPTLPALDKLQIALASGDGAIPVQALDLFLPAPPVSHMGTLDLTLVYPGGRMITPLGRAQVVQLGTFPQYFRLDTSHSADHSGEMHLYGNGPHNDIGSRETGTGIVHAAIDANWAAERALRLADDYLDDRLPIRFNKLVVDRLGERNAPGQYRLTVYGPTDISAYTARWSLGGGATETTRFNAGGTTTEQAHAGFDQVELVAPSGKVMATYQSSRDGVPLPAASIRVRSLDQNRLVPGASLTVTAQTDGVREDDAEDFVCRWQADPGFGSVEPAESPLRVSLIYGNCDTTLKLSDNPDIGGRSFPVKVSLVRKTGAQP